MYYVVSLFFLDFLIVNLEKFWSNSKFLRTKVQEDQVRINYILQKSGIQWFVEKDCSDISHCTVTASTKDGITVTLHVVTRHYLSTICQKDHNYYIWHRCASCSSSSKEDWKRILHSSSATGQNLIGELTKQLIIML